MKEETQRATVALLGGPDTDAAEIARLSQQLRRRLLELDVEDVRMEGTGEVPPGARSAEALSINSLVITLTPALITAVAVVLQGWLMNHQVVTIKLSLGGESVEVTPENAEALTRFARRHAEMPAEKPAEHEPANQPASE